MKKGPLLVFFSYFIWGLFPLYWKQLADLDSMFVLATRVVWSMAFCLLLALFFRQTPQIKAVLHDRKTLFIVAAAGVACSVNWGSYIVAVHLGRIVESSLAYYMNPLLSILLGAVAFQEKLSAAQWVAAGLACVGVAVSVIAYGVVPWLSLCISLSFLAYTALKKIITIDSRVSIFIETLTVTPLALGFILYAESAGIGAIGNLSGARLILLPLAGVVTSIPLLMFGRGMQSTPCSLGGVLMYINPTLQLLLGVLVYGEPFTKQNAVTFAFVWAAVIIFVTDSLLAARRARLAENSHSLST